MPLNLYESQLRLALLSVLGLWLIWLLVPFYGIGMTTQDQLDFSLLGASDRFWGAVVNAALDQGRIYFLVTKPIDLWVAAFPELSVVKFLNFSTFVLSVFAFAYTVFTHAAKRLLFVWVFFCFAWIGYQHLPPAAYPTVNHLPFFVWALIAWLVRLVAIKPSLTRKNAVLLFSLVFISFFHYEPITAFSLVCILWIVYITDFSQSTVKKKLVKLVFFAFVLYLASYITWAVINPSSYPGSQSGSFSIIEVGRVLFAYTIGAFLQLTTNLDPGLRWGDQVVGLIKFDYAEGADLGRATLFSAVLILVASIAMWRLYLLTTTPNESRRIRYLLPAFIFFIFSVGAINGPIALSEKYQSWAPHFTATYLTSHFILYPASFAIVWAISYLRARLGSRRQVALLLPFLILGACSFDVLKNNQSHSIKMRSLASKWDAMAMLANCSAQLGTRTFVWPQLFYNSAKIEKDWNDYWNTYTHQRFKIPIDVYASEGKLKPNTRVMHVKQHYAPNGGLRMLALDNERYTYLVSDNGSWPNYFLSSSGVPVDVDRKNYNHCGVTDYRIWQIARNNTFEHLEPYWGIAPIMARPEQFWIKVRLPTKQSTEASSDEDHTISLIDGWHDNEFSHVWSSGNQSTFSINLPSRASYDSMELLIEGHYFYKNEKTGVVINGKEQGKHVLGNKYFPIDLNAPDEQMITVILEHTSPISPEELGRSADSRKIKFALTGASIRLTQRSAFSRNDQ